MSELLTVLYEDDSLFIVRKAPGLLSQRDAGGDPDLITLLKGRGRRGEVYPIHRLDRGVGGLVVAARTHGAAAALSADFADHRRLTKEYLAVVHGTLDSEVGMLRHNLFHDERKRRTFVLPEGDQRGKEAVLTYRVLLSVPRENGKMLSLLLIRLETGRTHQIRAQFSAIGHPLAGDGRYGAHDRYPSISLYSARLAFSHPTTGARLDFRSLPQGISAFSEFLITDSVFEAPSSSDAKE